jgi:small subunit ribosomal protein S20
MPNTKSAERRMRNSARKQIRNASVASRLKTLQRNFVTSVNGGKKEDAAVALKSIISALDKAAKAGVLHHATASRKKSRLTLQLNRAK